MSEKVAAVVIGGGAIGLAIGRALSLRGLSTIVLEQHKICGMETSSRSSEVLHAGIYYPPSYLKTKLCIEGRTMLSKYLKERSIDHSICGKLILASNDDEVVKLQKLFNHGREALGLHELRMITQKEEIQNMEPSIVAEQAIWSPYSGIFDSHGVLEAFQLDIDNSAGSMVLTDCSFISAKPIIRSSNAIEISTSRGAIQCQWLVNAGGLSAQYIAHHIQGVPKQTIPKSYLAKGNYFKVAKKNNSSNKSTKVFQHLIYPLHKGDGGLGVHATIDLAGDVRFGPDVQWLPNSTTGGLEQDWSHQAPTHLDYTVKEDNLPIFYQEISRYWPTVTDYQLVPDYSGIRPKISCPLDVGGSVGNTMGAEDFLIQGPEVHGVTGLIQLFGIESPGWTSSMALAEYVTERYVIQDK